MPVRCLACVVGLWAPMYNLQPTASLYIDPVLVCRVSCIVTSLKPVFAALSDTLGIFRIHSTLNAMTVLYNAEISQVFLGRELIIVSSLHPSMNPCLTPAALSLLGLPSGEYTAQR